MKFAKLFCLSILVFSFAANGYSQTDVTFNDIREIVAHGNNVWCGTSSGLVCWDITDLTYKTYTTSDGLVSNYIRAIVIDKNNDIWVGTSGGVSHYNGTVWKNYTEDFSLREPNIYSMAVGHDGSIWVGTSGDGVFRYKDGSSVNYLPEDGLPGGKLVTVGIDSTVWAAYGTNLYYYDGTSWNQHVSEAFDPMNTITVLDIDRNGGLWVGTNESQLFLYDGKDWTEFPQSEYKLPYSPRDFAAGNDGRVWIASKDITCYDGETWTVFGGIPVNASFVAVDTNGSVWAGRWKQNGGLARYDGEKWDVIKIENSIAANNVNDVALGNNGDIWAATDSGLSRYNRGNWITYTTEDGLQHNYIRSIASSPDGSIWALTNGENGTGLAKFDGTEWTNHTNTEIMSNDLISAIGVDADGIVWIGIAHREYIDDEKYFFGTVCWYDGDTWNSYEITYDDRFNGVTSFAFSPDGDVWVGTHCGVLCYDGEKWTRYSYLDGLLDGDVNALAVGPDGAVFAAVGGYGISCYDGAEWSTVLDDNSDISFYDIMSISSMTVDNNGILWFGGSLGNLISYDGTEVKTCFDKNGYTISDVRSISVNEYGIVFGTRQGLYRYGYIPGIYKVIVTPFTVNVESDHSKKNLLPEKFDLYNNYPNPFNPSTTITYSLANPSHVTLSVYTMTGQKVETLADSYMSAGEHSAVFDGNGLASGMYFYQFSADGIQKSGRMTLVK